MNKSWNSIKSALPILLYLFIFVISIIYNKHLDSHFSIATDHLFWFYSTTTQSNGVLAGVLGAFIFTSFINIKSGRNQLLSEIELYDKKIASINLELDSVKNQLNELKAQGFPKFQGDFVRGNQQNINYHNFLYQSYEDSIKSHEYEINSNKELIQQKKAILSSKEEILQLENHMTIFYRFVLLSIFLPLTTMLLGEGIMRASRFIIFTGIFVSWGLISHIFSIHIKQMYDGIKTSLEQNR